MNKMMAAAALLVGVCGVAQAGDFYVAGDISRTRFSGLGSDTGASIAGGYQFNANWGAELGFRFLGSGRETFTSGANKWDISARYRSIQLSGLGYFPLSDSFSVFGRLGYGTVKAQERVSVISGTVSGSAKARDYRSSLLVGVGVDYALSKQLSIRGEYQRPASDVSVLALGLKYGF
ncbi:MAG: outer membrane beta-barrel protein [Ideonella sp.]|nr:outer membrane beta-barrel protein [Ideonella sp.]